MVIDDCLSEKPHTDENEIVGWHYDPGSGQTIKGINLIMALHPVKGVSLPVNYHLVGKPDVYGDATTGKHKRRANVTKNHIDQPLRHQAIGSQLPFRAALSLSPTKTVSPKATLCLPRGVLTASWKCSKSALTRTISRSSLNSMCAQ